MNVARMYIGRSALLFVGIVVSSALTGCASDITEPTEENVSSTTAALQKGGGGGTTDTCTDDWQNCYIDCAVSYPVDDHWRAGCEHNCDTFHRICGERGIGSSGGIVMR